MAIKIGVFCGSRMGASAVYENTARELGYTFAAMGIDLIYGGAARGTMGVLADAVLEKGGKVFGVITEHLFAYEIAHTEITELEVVGSMHERKALMAKLSDGFITIPGGVGTLDEFIEIFSWAQLGLHQKPFGILNTDNYFSHLLKFFSTMEKTGFLDQDYKEKLIVKNNVADLLNTIQKQI